MSCLLQCWNVPTHVPVAELQPLAVRVWAHGVLAATGGRPDKIGLVYLRAPSGKAKQTFYRYRDVGVPAPALFDKDGEPACALLIERDHPGTLRALVHPLFVLLCAPVNGAGVAFMRSMTAVAQRPAESTIHLYPSGSQVVEDAANSGEYVGIEAAACQVAYLVNRLVRGPVPQETIEKVVRVTESMLRFLPLTLRDAVVAQLRRLPDIYGAAASLDVNAAAHRLKEFAAKGRILAGDNVAEELRHALYAPLFAPEICEMDLILAMDTN